MDLVPSAVMLILGMVVIHSTVKLIQVNHVSYEDYQKKISDIIILRRYYDDYYKYLIEYEQSIDADNKLSLVSDIKEYFVSFSDLYGNILIKQYDIYSETFLDEILDLKDLIKQVQYGLIDLEQSGHFKNFDQLMTVSVDLKKEVYNLESHYILDPSSLNHIFSDTFARENLLYWSVTAMGLCGFVLIFLNGDKIRRLRRYNEERQVTVREMENRLAAMEAACEGIMIVDSEGHLNYMNEAMCDICLIDNRFDYIDEEWTEIFSENDLDFIATEVMSGLEQDGYWIGEFPLEREDGSMLHTEFSLTQLPGDGLIGTVQDITQRYVMEQEKRDLEDQFYQAQKMEAIGRLAGGVAHDFNNILAAINGFAEFLVEDLQEGSNEKKYAGNILQASAQAKELVEQMLTFSRRRDSIKETIDLAHSLHEIEGMMSASVPKSVEIKTQIEDQIYIDGNVTHISQMIMNLCVNASDAMGEDHGVLSLSLSKRKIDKNFPHQNVIMEKLPDPKETPLLRIDDINSATVRTILGHVEKDREYAQIIVSDTGEGISRVIMEHIFEPFFTTKAVDKGTGLGLSTVHGVVVGHRGMMIINSTLMKGSTFEIYLPLSDASSASSASVEEKADRKDIPDDFKPEEYNILLVEDNQTVRDVTENMLRRMGYNVEICADGLQALQYLKKNHDNFDLVVSDHNMPKMTGLELVENISLELPDLPFVFLSGYSEEEMYKKINHHPSIKAVLKKPVMKEDLAEAIKKVFEETKSPKVKPKKAVA
ncbi:MAG: response regulator [Alphaproteobacteria bacterium]|nr:response regulator [Alphaproteobacteria bacterium]